MADKESLRKKIKLQKVRNILKTLNGVKTLYIYEESEPVPECILEMRYDHSKQPDSRIAFKSDNDLIYQWITENMKLKNNDILFLLCEGVWVKIQIIDVMSAVQSLWNNIDDLSKGFTVLNETMDRLLEVGNDSRDEYNYLFDEYALSH